MCRNGDWLESKPCYVSVIPSQSPGLPCLLHTIHFHFELLLPHPCVHVALNHAFPGKSQSIYTTYIRTYTMLPYWNAHYFTLLIAGRVVTVLNGEVPESCCVELQPLSCHPEYLNSLEFSVRPPERTKWKSTCCHINASCDFFASFHCGLINALCPSCCYH